jgi:hypothetical protein
MTGPAAVAVAKEAKMKKIVFLVFCVLLGTGALVHAQEEQEGPEGFVFILGPRLGVSYAIMAPEDYSSALKSALPLSSAADYYPVNSLFAVTQ